MRMEEAPYSGDTWIFRRIDDLARRGLLASTASGLAVTPEGEAAAGWLARQAPDRDSLRMLRSRKRRSTGP